MKRKTVPLALVLVCLLSLFTFPVFAANPMITSGDVAMSMWHTMLLKSDGSLWAWGNNIYGQFGVDSPKSSAVPIRIMDGVQSVASGYGHTMILMKDGSLWGCGYNYYGEIGNGKEEEQRVPLTKIMDDVKEIACSHSTTWAIKTDGSLWGWGSNYNGVFSSDKTVLSSYDGAAANRNVLSPAKIMDDVLAVAPGTTIMALKKDHTLWTWGSNDFGGIGDGTVVDSTDPKQVMAHVVAISNDIHSAAIKDDGSLWMWGRNSYGELGTGTIGNVTSPMRVMDGVKDVSVQGYHTMIVKNDQSLWACGSNYQGILGDGTEINRETPVEIMNNVIKAYAGQWNSVAVQMDGSLWIWGDNMSGTIGDGVSGPIDGSLLKNYNRASPFKLFDSVISVDSGLPSEWARGEVDQAIEQELVPPELQSTYSFEITRAEFCTLAVTLIEKRAQIKIDATVEFSDTTDMNVIKLASLNIVNGVGDGRFNPDGKITREQAAKMLALTARYLGLEHMQVEKTPFSDAGSISVWAAEFVDYVASAGIMTGVSATQFSPQASYTREQSVITIYRLSLLSAD